MANARVGIAEAAVVRNPDSVTTLGLGSCIGVAMFDSVNRIGGLVHVMLPSSSLSKTKDFNAGKFADTGVPLLLDMMLKAGASKARIVAKIAGGALMFAIGGGGETVLRIGPQNTDACKAALKKLGIPLIAEETGGNHGRTVELFCDSGEYEIRAIGKEKKRI